MRRVLVLLDTDFDGARFGAACAAHGGRRLHYIALAQRPVDASHLPEQWRTQWPLCVPGLHRMVSHDGLVTLDVLIGEPMPAWRNCRHASMKCCWPGYPPPWRCWRA